MMRTTMMSASMTNVVSSVSLPIHTFKDELVNSVDKYSTTIVVGETGSGVLFVNKCDVYFLIVSSLCRKIYAAS